MLKTFRVINFLSIDDKTYSFGHPFENYINEEGLKAFFILKFLVTLSEQKPELVSLINNEIRPNPLKPLYFELTAIYNDNNYYYKIGIDLNNIICEVLMINNKEVFNRSTIGIILNNEQITWSCPNQNHKVFLDACAVNDNLNNAFLYSFKENILGISKFTKNPLDDDINKLFNNESSSITSIIKSILIIDEYYCYGDDIDKLNKILIKNNIDIPLFNKDDIRLNDFLRLSINLSWLMIIGGGTLFLDERFFSFKSYLKSYLTINNFIQIIYLNN